MRGRASRTLLPSWWVGLGQLFHGLILTTQVYQRPYPALTPAYPSAQPQFACIALFSIFNMAAYWWTIFRLVRLSK